MPRWSAGVVGASFEMDISQSISQMGRVLQVAGSTVSGINRALSGIRVGNLANSFGAIAASIAPVGSAIVNTVQRSVQTFSRLQQSMAGMSTILRGQAQGAIDNAANAFYTSGLNMSQYMENSMGIMNLLLQDASNTVQDVTNLTEMAMQNAGDISALYGIPAETVLGVIQSISRGIYITFDNLRLGYAGTKSGVEQMIADAGLANEAFNEMGNLNFETFLRALDITVNRLGITGTAARQAETTIQGSLRRISAGIYNLLGLLPSDPTPEIQQTIQTLMNGIWEGIQSLAGQLRNAIRNLWDNLPLSDFEKSFIAFLAILNPGLRTMRLAIDAVRASWTAMIAPLQLIRNAVDSVGVSIAKVVNTNRISGLEKSIPRQEALVKELTAAYEAQAQRLQVLQRAQQLAQQRATEATQFAEQQLAYSRQANYQMQLQYENLIAARKAATAAAEEAAEWRIIAIRERSAAAWEMYAQARTRSDAAHLAAQASELNYERAQTNAQMRNTIASEASVRATEAEAQAQRILNELERQQLNTTRAQTVLQQQQARLTRQQTVLQQLQQVQKGFKNISSLGQLFTASLSAAHPVLGGIVTVLGTISSVLGGVIKLAGRLVTSVAKISFVIMLSQLGNILRNVTQIQQALANIPNVLNQSFSRLTGETSVFGRDLDELRQKAQDILTSIGVDTLNGIILAIENMFDSIIRAIDTLATFLQDGFDISDIFRGAEELGHSAATILGLVTRMFTSVLQAFGVDLQELRTTISMWWIDLTSWLENSGQSVIDFFGHFSELFGNIYIDAESTPEEIYAKAEESATEELEDNYKNASKVIRNFVEDVQNNDIVTQRNGNWFTIDEDQLSETITAAQSQVNLLNEILAQGDNPEAQAALNNYQTLLDILTDIQRNHGTFSADTARRLEELFTATATGGGALPVNLGQGIIESFDNIDDAVIEAAMSSMSEKTIDKFIKTYSEKAKDAKYSEMFHTMLDAMDKAEEKAFLQTGTGEKALDYVTAWVDELQTRPSLNEAQTKFVEFWTNADDAARKEFLDEHKSYFVETLLSIPEGAPTDSEEYKTLMKYVNNMTSAASEDANPIRLPIELTNTTPEIPEYPEEWRTNASVRWSYYHGDLDELMTQEDYLYGLVNGWGAVVDRVTTVDDAITKLDSGVYTLGEGFSRVGDEIYHVETLSGSTSDVLTNLVNGLQTGLYEQSDSVRQIFANIYSEAFDSSGFYENAQEMEDAINEHADVIFDYLDMKAQGYTGEQLQEMTGLTEEQIQKIDEALSAIEDEDYEAIVNVNVRTEGGGVNVQSDTVRNRLGISKETQGLLADLDAFEENARAILDGTQQVVDAIFDAITTVIQDKYDKLKEAIDDEKDLLEDELDYIDNWYDERTIQIQTALEEGVITQETANAMQGNLDQEHLRQTKANQDAQENIEDDFRDESGNSLADYYNQLEALNEAKVLADQEFAIAEMEIMGTLDIIRGASTKDWSKLATGIASVVTGLVMQFTAGYEAFTFDWKGATGGVVTRPTRALIGEAGAEAIVPLENNTEWLNKVSDRLMNNMDTAARMNGQNMYSTNNSITNNFTYNSPKTIDAALANKLLKRTSRRLVTGVY